MGIAQWLDRILFRPGALQDLCPTSSPHDEPCQTKTQIEGYDSGYSP